MKLPEDMKVNFYDAIKHLEYFLEIDNPQILKEHFTYAVQNATTKLLHYRKKYGVNMENEEILRDVIFIGASLFERLPSNPEYYKATIKAAFALVEIATDKSFDNVFVEKMLKAYKDFSCPPHFNVESLYFVFKGHLRC